MDWKEFLKPDLRKILVFVILSLILYFIPIDASYESWDVQGLPIPAYICYKGEELTPFVSFWLINMPMPPCGFIYQFLIIDLIFWYLLSCLIVWVYNKVKKK